MRTLAAAGAHPKAPGWYSLGDETPIAKANDRDLLQIAELLERTAAVMPPYTWPEVKAKTPEQQLKLDFEIACGYTPNLALVEKVLADRPDWVNYGLYEAIHHNRMDITKMLLSVGGDINGFMPFACWLTPFMHTLRYKEPRWEMAELLLDLGVPINGTNGLGMSPLHILVFYGMPETVSRLLDLGADINLTEPEFCSTALGWAARWGRTEMAKLLLQRGANTKHAGADWSTPMAWALKNRHTAIVELFK